MSQDAIDIIGIVLLLGGITSFLWGFHDSMSSGRIDIQARGTLLMWLGGIAAFVSVALPWSGGVCTP